MSRSKLFMGLRWVVYFKKPYYFSRLKRYKKTLVDCSELYYQEALFLRRGGSHTKKTAFSLGLTQLGKTNTLYLLSLNRYKTFYLSRVKDKTT